MRGVTAPGDGDEGLAPAYAAVRARLALVAALFGIATLGWVGARNTRRDDLNREVFLAGGGVRMVAADPDWFLSEQPATTSTHTDAVQRLRIHDQRRMATWPFRRDAAAHFQRASVWRQEPRRNDDAGRPALLSVPAEGV